MERRIYRKWIVSVLVVVLLTVVFPGCQWRQQETGYTVIQAIIEGLSDYQDEIESWGIPGIRIAENDRGANKSYKGKNIMHN